MALVRRRELVRIERELDVFVARERAAEIAMQAGFDTYQTSAIETAVSELCTNVLKYGERGWASLRVDETELSAVVTDEGPGFGAAPDGSGLGMGLAGAARLMGQLSVESRPGRSRVQVSKPLPDARTGSEGGWQVDVTVRSRWGRRRSGDCHWAGGDEDVLVAAVVDGLGSGPRAAEAAQVVAMVIADHDWDHPLDDMMDRVHSAARSTRGAAAAVVRVRASTRQLEYVSIGDVSGVAGPPDEPIRGQPGVVGVELPDVVVRRATLADTVRVALWTDGVELSGSVAVLDVGGDPGDVVEAAVIDHGLERDDGLLLLATRLPAGAST